MTEQGDEPIQWLEGDPFPDRTFRMIVQRVATVLSADLSTSISKEDLSDLPIEPNLQIQVKTFLNRALSRRSTYPKEIVDGYYKYWAYVRDVCELDLFHSELNPDDEIRSDCLVEPVVDQEEEKRKMTVLIHERRYLSFVGEITNQLDISYDDAGCGGAMHGFADALELLTYLKEFE